MIDLLAVESFTKNSRREVNCLDEMKFLKRRRTRLEGYRQGGGGTRNRWQNSYVDQP